jgi:hypothetical protein
MISELLLGAPPPPLQQREHGHDRDRDQHQGRGDYRDHLEAEVGPRLDGDELAAVQADPEHRRRRSRQREGTEALEHGSSPVLGLPEDHAIGSDATRFREQRISRQGGELTRARRAQQHALLGLDGDVDHLGSLELAEHPGGLPQLLTHHSVTARLRPQRFACPGPHHPGHEAGAVLQVGARLSDDRPNTYMG